jgi:hypothetical protein
MFWFDFACYIPIFLIQNFMEFLRKYGKTVVDIYPQ